MSSSAEACVNLQVLIQLVYLFLCFCRYSGGRGPQLALSDDRRVQLNRIAAKVASSSLLCCAPLASPSFVPFRVDAPLWLRRFPRFLSDADLCNLDRCQITSMATNVSRLPQVIPCLCLRLSFCLVRAPPFVNAARLFPPPITRLTQLCTSCCVRSFGCSSSITMAAVCAVPAAVRRHPRENGRLHARHEHERVSLVSPFLCLARSFRFNFSLFRMTSPVCYLSSHFRLFLLPARVHCQLFGVCCDSGSLDSTVRSGAGGGAGAAGDAKQEPDG